MQGVILKMKIEKAICPHCGAPVRIKPGKRVMNCAYCDMQIIIETARKTPADQSRPRDISAHFSYRLLLDFWLYFPVFSYLRLCSSVFCESIYSLTFSMTVVPVVAMK